MSLDPNQMYESSGLKKAQEKAQERAKKIATNQAKRIAKEEFKKRVLKYARKKALHRLTKGLGKHLAKTVSKIIIHSLLKILGTVLSWVTSLFLAIGWPVVAFFIIVLVLCFLAYDYNFDGQSDKLSIHKEYEKASVETIDSTKPDQIEWKVPTGLIAALAQVSQNRKTMGGNYSDTADDDVLGGADAIVEGAIEWYDKHIIKYEFDGPGMEAGHADCSQFTQYIFKKYGNINIGRTTGAQLQTPGGKRVKKEELLPGDLVFFKHTYKSKYIEGVSHVGIYIGNGEVIHNSGSSPSGIKRMNLDKLISAFRSVDGKEHWLTGLRILPMQPKIPVSPVPITNESTPPAQYIPIYKAASARYGVPWNLLAAIHFQETTFSTDKNMVSNKGAIGHMQVRP